MDFWGAKPVEDEVGRRGREANRNAETQTDKTAAREWKRGRESRWRRRRRRRNEEVETEPDKKEKDRERVSSGKRNTERQRDR